MNKAISRVYRSIKLIFLFYALLLFLFGNKGERITCAMGSHLFLTLATPEPMVQSTADPTVQATADPTVQATSEPTAKVAPEPTVKLTPEPTVKPTAEPTVNTTSEPTAKPTAEPTVKPIPEPTAKLTPEPAPKATPKPTVKPTAEPTANSTPIAGRIAVQPRQDTSTRQPFPIAPPHVPSAAATSATPTSTSPLETGTPPIVTSLPDGTTVLSALPLDAVQQDNTPLRLILVLGIVAPLLLITAGTLWLVRKWLINRHKLVSAARDNSDKPIKPRGRKAYIETRS
jgi:hypothetical protein